MKYEHLSVKQFLEGVKSENIDLENFLAKVVENSKYIQKKCNPFITVIENLKKPENKGKLFGLPISVKDNICTKGIQTTAGSKILQNYIPSFNATCVENILKEGSTVIGKTAMDEFGFGTFSVNGAYSIPKNPLDLERSCGGSSGGSSCIAAASNFPHVSIAESTGGSISCPASFTGTVGLTPTYGKVSRYGLIDFANSLDKIGCIGKNVYDVALLLSAISGADNYDSTAFKNKSEDFTKYCTDDVKGLKIGIPKEYFENVDEKITKLIWDSIKLFESHGAEYEEISLPHTKYALPTYYIIAMVEASTNLAKFCGMRYGLQMEIKENYDEYFSNVRIAGFGEEAKRRIILGTFARMAGYRDAYYLKALKVRTKIIEDFKKAFSKFDVLIAPTMPVTAPKFSEIEKLEPIDIYMIDVLTVAPNLAGVPHVSVPCGHLDGLPVGLHIMSDHMQEGKAIQTAYMFEKAGK